MSTQQDTETDILARAVERMSQELADERIRCEGYRRALHRIVLDADLEFHHGIDAQLTPYTIASRALNP